MNVSVRYVLVVIYVIFGVVGCANTSVKPLTAVDTSYGKEEDENILIQRARQFAEDLEAKGLIMRNAEIQEYIDRVGTSLIPPDASDAASFKFRMLRVPIINAMALPDGSIYLTVGMLARLENEVQLAQVMGHEIGHIILRHMLRAYRSKQAKNIAAHVADIVLFGTSIAYIPYGLSVARYSRELEEEADSLGLELISNAGYCLSETHRLFEIMQEVRSSEAVRESIYSSHPSNTERAEFTRNLVHSGTLSLNPTGIIGEDEYAAVKYKLILENIRLKLAAKQYELALESAERGLSRCPSSPWLHSYRGEAYRCMAEDPDGAAREHAWLYGKEDISALVQEFESRKEELLKSALSSFRKALSYEEDLAWAYRGIGLSAFQLGDYDGARQALEYYLENGYNIPDGRYIQHILKRIQHYDQEM